MARRGLTGILLAGGESRRFGSPKAQAVFEGETLHDRAWRLLGEACDERILVGPGDDPGTGPVGAVAAGLGRAAHEVAVVIPVDMPLLTVEALHALADACRDAAVAQHGPLPCAIRRDAWPETAERRLRTVLDGLDVARIDLDDRLLLNVNEPADIPITGVFRVGGDAYDDFMGRYSARLAPLFADFAGARGRVLDVGAGTGMLTRELLERGCEVAAAEPSPEFCATLRERFPTIEVVQAPAEELPFADGAFHVAAAQLVVAFMADGPRAVAEMARVARTVAVCMWGLKEVEMFAAIDRTAKVVGAQRSQEGATRYRTQDELVALLEPLGAVETATLDVTASYEGFDDFWHALAGRVGPAGAWLQSMDDDQLARAREELHRQLGSPDGAFELTGRCYAARVSTEARSAPVPTSVT